MKKALKITLISIISLIAVSALVVFVFFPGIFTYFKVKKEFPSIENELTEITKLYMDKDEVPDDYVEAECDGVTVKGPSYAVNNNTTGMVPFKEKDNLIVMVTKSEVRFAEYGGEYDQYDYDDYEHFFDSLDVPMPETQYESRKFINGMQAKDCLKLRGKDLDVFMELAEYKDIVYSVETPYIYKHNGNKGFICDVASKNYTYHYNADFFTEENEYVISVLSNNIETVKRVIASIEITEE